MLARTNGPKNSEYPISNTQHPITKEKLQPRSPHFMIGYWVLDILTSPFLWLTNQSPEKCHQRFGFPRAAAKSPLDFCRRRGILSFCGFAPLTLVERKSCASSAFC